MIDVKDTTSNYMICSVGIKQVNIARINGCFANLDNIIHGCMSSNVDYCSTVLVLSTFVF